MLKLMMEIKMMLLLSASCQALQRTRRRTRWLMAGTMRKVVNVARVWKILRVLAARRVEYLKAVRKEADCFALFRHFTHYAPFFAFLGGGGNAECGTQKIEISACKGCFISLVHAYSRLFHLFTLGGGTAISNDR
jgi:hypothetical protein